MSPLAKPSRTFHAVCAYWLTSSHGSRAKAQRQHARRMASAKMARLYLFALCTEAHILHQEAVRFQRSSISECGRVASCPDLRGNRPCVQLITFDSLDYRLGAKS